MKHAKEIAVGAVLVVLAGAGFYFTQQDRAVQTPPQEIVQSSQAVVEAQTTDINKQFEDVLNEFLHSINDKAKAYREERKVLGDLVRPENLRDPAYIEQNYQMMKGTIPSLRLKIDDLMKVFEDTEVKVKTLLEGQSPDMTAAVMSEWQELKKQQANLYIDFFKIEDEVLQTYEALMDLLYAKKDAFKVDLASAKFIFTDPADEQLVKDLRLRLVDLAEQESVLLDRQAGNVSAP